MKNKIIAVSALSLVLALSACGGIPECQDKLDECNMGGAYTEERTAQVKGRDIYVQTKPPVVEEKVEVMVEPAPIDDTPVMQSAEPQFTQISK